MPERIEYIPTTNLYSLLKPIGQEDNYGLRDVYHMIMNRLSYLQKPYVLVSLEEMITQICLEYYGSSNENGLRYLFDVGFIAPYILLAFVESFKSDIDPESLKVFCSRYKNDTPPWLSERDPKPVLKVIFSE